MAEKTNTLRLWTHVRQVAPLSGDKTKDDWFTLNLTPVLLWLIAVFSFDSSYLERRAAAPPTQLEVAIAALFNHPKMRMSRARRIHSQKATHQGNPVEWARG